MPEPPPLLSASQRPPDRAEAAADGAEHRHLHDDQLGQKLIPVRDGRNRRRDIQLTGHSPSGQIVKAAIPAQRHILNAV